MAAPFSSSQIQAPPVTLSKMVKDYRHLEARIANKQSELEHLRSQLRDMLKTIAQHMTPGEQKLVRIGSNLIYVKLPLTVGGELEIEKVEVAA